MPASYKLMIKLTESSDFIDAGEFPTIEEAIAEATIGRNAYGYKVIEPLSNRIEESKNA